MENAQEIQAAAHWIAQSYHGDIFTMTRSRKELEDALAIVMNTMLLSERRGHSDMTSVYLAGFSLSDIPKSFRKEMQRYEREYNIRFHTCEDY